MNTQVIYREILEDEIEAACLLVADVFREFVAPGYSTEGVEEFLKYIDPGCTRNRLKNNHFILVAIDNDHLAGIIEIRNHNHLSLCFIRKEYQGKGIGRQLYTLTANRIRKYRPDIKIIDVNSAPDSTGFYEKLGFTATDKEQIVNGIRSTPMATRIDEN